jgi:hypothetical protein
MRTREEIEGNARGVSPKELAIEVLLDIRDLLTDQKIKLGVEETIALYKDAKVDP